MSSEERPAETPADEIVVDDTSGSEPTAATSARESRQDGYDVVIVGGGAAGLSAALVLARARRHVLVIDAGAPRNAPATHLHGFLSRDGLPPQELLAIGRREIASYGAEIVSDAVTDIRTGSPGGFGVVLASGRHTTGRRLLVATGLRDELPQIAGLRERWARDVLHCPYCHGWEVRDREIGVISDGSPESIRHAHLVRQWSADLMLFVPPGCLTPDQVLAAAGAAISVVEGTIDRVQVENDRLVGVQLGDGQSIRREVLFVLPRFVPNNDLLIHLGCEVDGGWVVKDEVGRTTVPGVWVAGNVANPRAQVITAAGEGSAAAIAMNADLVNEDIATGGPSPFTAAPTLVGNPGRASGRPRLLRLPRRPKGHTPTTSSPIRGAGNRFTLAPRLPSPPTSPPSGLHKMRAGYLIMGLGVAITPAAATPVRCCSAPTAGHVAGRSGLLRDAAVFTSKTAGGSRRPRLVGQAVSTNESRR